jgi:hypothetical protein
VHVRQSRSHEHADPAQQVRRWNALVEAECAEEPGLIDRATPHHQSHILPT